MIYNICVSAAFNGGVTNRLVNSPHIIRSLTENRIVCQIDRGQRKNSVNTHLSLLRTHTHKTE